MYSIWVIVDKLIKSAHFIPISESISVEKLADIYVQEVVIRHRVPVSVVSDYDVCFDLKMLEDMLQACVLDFGWS